MSPVRYWVSAAILVIAAPAFTISDGRSSGVKFAVDDPIWVDFDRLSIPEPRSIELSKGYDLLENTFWDPTGGLAARRAANVNSVDEVPDSSWYTNRIALHAMSLAELVRGPNRGQGPDTTRPWKVVSLKTQGITPGLTIRDARGETYILKFDPPENPQMATSAEVISTRFFHAFGYHVPENYLVFFTNEQLELDPDASYNSGGRRHPLVRRTLESILDRVPRVKSGAMQALASRALPGKPIGPFKYYGTRSDDPNDLFNHEDRRELRALRVFDSFLNHNDSDAVNTLDCYVEEGGRHFLRHYLIDFGTTLGSGAFEPKALRAGNEYYIEPGPWLRSALTLGIWDRGWRAIDHPRYPSIGRFESDHFDPTRWKPDYPNPAHDRMQPADSLWAARMLLRLDDQAIRALVQTGQFEDKDAEAYLTRTLARRREKLVAYYLERSNPIANFGIAEGGSVLQFEDLALAAHLCKSNSYEFQWFQFDNANNTNVAVQGTQTTASRSVRVPSSKAEFLKVRIRTAAPGRPAWGRYVDVYIRNSGTRTVVGVEREA